MVRGELETSRDHLWDREISRDKARIRDKGVSEEEEMETMAESLGTEEEVLV
jgi:hypothetical protein